MPVSRLTKYWGRDPFFARSAEAPVFKRYMVAVWRVRLIHGYSRGWRLGESAAGLCRDSQWNPFPTFYRSDSPAFFHRLDGVFMSGEQETTYRINCRPAAITGIQPPLTCADSGSEEIWEAPQNYLFIPKRRKFGAPGAMMAGVMPVFRWFGIFMGTVRARPKSAGCLIFHTKTTIGYQQLNRLYQKPGRCFRNPNKNILSTMKMVAPSHQS